MLILAAVLLLCAIIAATIGFALLGGDRSILAQVFFGFFLLLCIAATLAGVWHWD